MRFDDIEIGSSITVGTWVFETDAILDFARDFDPQPFHVDEAAAAESHFGGLIASGWHTCAAWMRLTVDHAVRYGDLAGISPGLEEIRWLKPVRPGDAVTYTNTVIAKRRLASRPGWALITNEAVGVNQAGDQVYGMRGPVLVPIED
jgi:acyl dehydratase